MIAPLLLAALAALADAPDVPDVSGAASVETAGHARLSFEPEAAELGQPVLLVAEITHPADTPLAWASLEPQPDGSWVVLGRELRPSRELADGERGASVAWTVASLEPGPRRAPEAFRAALEQAGIVLIGLEPVLEVTGVLAEGEDAPRGLRGFPPSLVPEALEREPGHGLLWPLVALLATLVPGLWLLAARRRGRREPAPRAPLAQLAGLRALASSPEGVREATFGLSRLVREAADERSGRARAGLTDEEWLERARHDEALPQPARDELAGLFARFREVKYAGARPSAWATEESFAAVQGLLEELAAAPATRVEPARRRKRRQEVHA